MFTGIIESLGTINNIEESNSSLKIIVAVSDIIFNETAIGASISINGVCLTVTKKERNQHLLFFDIINETLNKTNLKLLKISEQINLETALKRMQRSGQWLSIVTRQDRREVGIVALQDILRVLFGEVGR